MEEVTSWRVCELRLEFIPGLSGNITSRDSPLLPLLPEHNHSCFILISISRAVYTERMSYMFGAYNLRLRNVN